MNSTNKEHAYEKVKEAILNLTQAEKEYGEIVEQYISIAPVVIGKPAPSPKRALDEKGIAEIKRAESKKQTAQKILREALDLYYRTKS